MRIAFKTMGEHKSQSATSEIRSTYLSRSCLNQNNISDQLHTTPQRRLPGILQDTTIMLPVVIFRSPFGTSPEFRELGCRDTESKSHSPDLSVSKSTSCASSTHLVGCLALLLPFPLPLPDVLAAPPVPSESIEFCHFSEVDISVCEFVVGRSSLVTYKGAKLLAATKKLGE